MIQKKWFRVETASDGSILSCEEVEAKGRSGSVVRFYEAADKADACSQAKEWYERRRQQDREQSAKNRSERKALGLCSRSGCRSKPEKGRSYCARCSANKNEENKLRRQRRRDGDFSDSRINAGIQREKHGTQQSYRWWLLLQRFDELGPVAFRAWLVSKIPAMQSAVCTGCGESGGSHKDTCEWRDCVHIAPGKRAKKARIDWFESSLEKAQAAE